MAAPKGNKNALGNKGGGRKSAYQEMADAERLYRNFFEPKSLKKLAKRIEKGTYSPEDMWIMKMLQGNTRLLEATINKIWSEKIEDTTKKTLLDFLRGDQEDE